MRKLICKVCGGSDFLVYEGRSAHCLDCGINYLWDDALALETVETTLTDEDIDSFMDNYDMYYDKYYRPMMDSHDDCPNNGSDT